LKGITGNLKGKLAEYLKDHCSFENDEKFLRKDKSYALCLRLTKWSKDKLFQASAWSCDKNVAIKEYQAFYDDHKKSDGWKWYLVAEDAIYGTRALVDYLNSSDSSGRKLGELEINLDSSGTKAEGTNAEEIVNDGLVNWKEGSKDPKPFHLIQGPPGTGKTYTSAKYIFKWLKEPEPEQKQVLISAPTHKAVDELFEKLVKYERFEAMKEVFDVKGADRRRPVGADDI